MKIELKIRRKNGSHVTLGGTTYHFKPEGDDPNGPHVAEVKEQAHIERLLAIPQYVPAKDTAAGRKAKAQAEEKAEEQEAQDNDPNTGLGGVSIVYDSGAGIDSPANTPQSAKPTPEQAEAALVAEHEAQARGEGGSQSPEHKGTEEKAAAKSAKSEGKTTAKKSAEKGKK